MGIPYDIFKAHAPTADDLVKSGISGLHFHTLCEQLFEPLDRTLSAVEEQFGEYLHHVEWVNLVVVIILLILIIMWISNRAG